MLYHRILNIVPVLYSGTFLCIHSVCNSLHLLVKLPIHWNCLDSVHDFGKGLPLAHVVRNRIKGNLHLLLVAGIKPELIVPFFASEMLPWEKWEVSEKILQSKGKEPNWKNWRKSSLWMWNELGKNENKQKNHWAYLITCKMMWLQ